MSASTQKQKKKEGNTLIFESMLSSGGGQPLIQVEVLLLLKFELKRRRGYRRCENERVNIPPAVKEIENCEESC